MADAVQVPSPFIQICLTGGGVDFHSRQSMAKRRGESIRIISEGWEGYEMDREARRCSYDDLIDSYLLGCGGSINSEAVEKGSLNLS